MRTIIAGSRTAVAEDVIAAVRKSGFDVSLVLCGCAMGADEYGKQWANANGIVVEEYPANWSEHGKAAGPIRNATMANNADALIAVWDGMSRGTANMIDIAKRKGLAVHVHRIHVET